MDIQIYALVDPDTAEVRYIGKSIRAVKRYSDHLVDKGSTRKCRWIAKLFQQNKQPILIILDDISDESVVDWQSSERFWIKFYKDLGHDLCNHTDGGEGLNSPDQETRQKIAAIRKVLWETDKEKYMAILRSPGRCAKISKALKGKKKNEAHLAKIRALPQNTLGFDKSHLTAEQRAKHAHPGNQYAKGSKRTPEFIEQQRLRQTGKKRSKTWKQPLESNEQRSKTLIGRKITWAEKISRAALRRWADPEKKRMQSDKIKAWHQKRRSEKSELKGDYT